jgi:magnesium-transporting ATPase (P-type)
MMTDPDATYPATAAHAMSAGADLGAPQQPSATGQGLPGDAIVSRAPIGSLILASFGLILFLTPLLALRWPTDPNSPTLMGPHIARITTAPDGEVTGALIARITLNIGIYIIFLVSLGAVIIGWVRRNAAIGRVLVTMAALGLMYMAGMALYTAAAIAIFGLLLQLFAGLSIWITSTTEYVIAQARPTLEMESG